MDKAASLLPNTIELATKGTPVTMLMRIVPRENIEAFLAIELTKAASRLNVDERLNLQGHQIQFVCSQLLELYPNESLADFKICFERGIMGRYDEKLLRLDGAVITQWMAKYLEEKYQVIESQLMAEKENPYEARHQVNKVSGANPERNILSLLETVNGQKEIPSEVLKHLTPEQLKEIEEARKAAPVKDFESNDYVRIKLKHAKEKRERQSYLNRVSSEFYKDRENLQLKQWEDDNGFYVLAENEKDAIEIYTLASKK